MNLRTTEEIERAIGELAPHPVEELYAWVDRNYPPPIDTRIQLGLADGRLDQTVQQALDDEQRVARGFCSSDGASRP